MASAMHIGQQLVTLCNQGKSLEAIDPLYAPNIVSIEAQAHPPFPARLEGIKDIRAKTVWWLENHEVHKGEARGPWPNGDRFVVMFNYEVTPKAGPMAGKRMPMEEAALYTVKNGKIVQEEFFYHMGG